MTRSRCSDAALAAMLAAAALHGLLHAGFTMDDAGISYSYARSLADGMGLGVLDAGGQRVEGYSNLSWVLLLALAHRVGLPIAVVAKVLGAASFAASAWLLHSILVHVVRRPLVRWAGLLFPLATCVAFWSMSGLESGIYLLLLLAAVRLLLWEEATPTPWNVGSAAVLVLAGLTRPDAFVFSAAAVASKLVGLATARGERRARLAHVAAWAAVLAAGYGAYLGWHVAVFGYLFPNTVYAKRASPTLVVLLRGLADPDSKGWQYVGSWMWSRGGLALIPGALVGLVAAVRGPARSIAAFAAAALLLPLVHPDWMVEHRFLVPLVPFAVALAAAGVETLLDAADRSRDRTGLARRAVAVAAVAAALLYAFVNVRASVERRASGYAGAVTMDAVRDMYAHLFDVPVRELGLSRPLVALPDIGATTFELGMRVLDVAALADAQIAHAQGLDEMELYVFEERRPDLVHAHGDWARGIGATKRFQADYVVFSGNENGFQAVRKDLFVDRHPGVMRARLAGSIDLVGIEAPGAAEPAATVVLDLFLSSPQDASAPVELMVRLVRPDHTVVSEARVPCGPSFFPPERWKRDERVRQRVSLPVATADGPLAVEVLARGAGEREYTARFARPVVVDREAARESARELQARARALADAGEVDSMHRLLDMAEAAAPGAASWSPVRAECERSAARAIAEKAEALRTRGPVEWLVGVIRRADRLGAARTAPELRALALRLSELGGAERDPLRAYLWHRASWYADPQAATAQRRLSEARRALFGAAAAGVR